ncbi:hypothetical protein ABIB73_000090 [Bradyrhizobium sp. F1.4.3]|uniref:hypothetical protein n=1 Tax=Bradyrhizobium sp. F1.4.3 TaxID=3156356 RepID=UPI003397B2D1
MKKNAPPWANTAARGSSAIASESIAIKPNTAPAQETPSHQVVRNGAQPSAPIEIAHIGRVWKSARDKTRCLQFDIKEFRGNAYLDCRAFVLDADGRMQPTDQRLTIGTKQLAKLADMIGRSYRKAYELGLTAGSS